MLDTSEDRIERLNTTEPDWEAKEERALVRKLDLRVLFPCGKYLLHNCFFTLCSLHGQLSYMCWHTLIGPISEMSRFYRREGLTLWKPV
jgi:hypothetical protein